MGEVERLTRGMGRGKFQAAKDGGMVQINRPKL
jgi:hypothetical protein